MAIGGVLPALWMQVTLGPEAGEGPGRFWRASVRGSPPGVLCHLSERQATPCQPRVAADCSDRSSVGSVNQLVPIWHDGGPLLSFGQEGMSLASEGGRN